MQNYGAILGSVWKKSMPALIFLAIISIHTYLIHVLTSPLATGGDLTLMLTDYCKILTAAASAMILLQLSPNNGNMKPVSLTDLTIAVHYHSMVWFFGLEI